MRTLGFAFLGVFAWLAACAPAGDPVSTSAAETIPSPVPDGYVETPLGLAHSDCVIPAPSGSVIGHDKNGNLTFSSAEGAVLETHTACPSTSTFTSPATAALQGSFLETPGTVDPAPYDDQWKAWSYNLLPNLRPPFNEFIGSLAYTQIVPSLPASYTYPTGNVLFVWAGIEAMQQASLLG